MIHQGYLDVIKGYETDTVAIFDESITSQFREVQKDIRALNSSKVAGLLNGLGYHSVVVNESNLLEMINNNAAVTFIDDPISRHLIAKDEFANHTFKINSPFLRWNRQTIPQSKKITPDEIAQLPSDFLTQLLYEASASTDWWRHVAAALISDDGIVHASHNHSIPHDYIGSFEGDPRASAHKGEGIENSIFIHAEADLIATLAREGIPTHGKAIYVTTFPCPNCAKLISASGINTVYYIDGYGMLDGEDVLRRSNVKIVQIDTTITETTNSQRLRPYPEN